MSEPAPDPGPRPADFEFPFAAAARALAAIEDLVARWRSVAHAHRDAAQHACVGFEGRTRELFDGELRTALGDCAHAIRELEAQRDRIEAVVGAAQRRSRQAGAELDAWERRRREFVNAP
jgi:hypothetical protein